MPTIRYVTSNCAVDFAEGDDVNLLRVAIRNECAVPYRCASGNCGTDRVFVESGHENLSPPRRRERDRLGELLEQGWRLACQTYVSGDCAVTWDPDQRALDERAVDRALPSVVIERLKRRWLSEDDTAGGEPTETTPEEAPPVTAASEPRWLDVGDTAEVLKRRKFVITDDDEEIVVLAHDGQFYAMDNKCIHRGRELVKGVVLRDRLVCAGHQWAFDLRSGWESVKEECQPVYAVRVTDAGRVEIDLASRTVNTR